MATGTRTEAASDKPALIPMPAAPAGRDLPLTSEPPLADHAPLTAEGPLAAEPPLTAEPNGI
ncbi:hypothetical protein [Streptomyces hoynatensis]|uniref:hypothetical protein n=1 Tax=Streptomyces hoynatensis TaxID=1141874 RepID=UPI0011C430EE|nr:hypothetical protein [Streptomyces hoynatensis]